MDIYSTSHPELGGLNKLSATVRIASDRQRMPAEWEPHAATIILYPHNPCTFRSTDDMDGKCEPARREARNVVRAIAECGEDVLVILGDKDLTHNDRKRVEEVIQCEAGQRKRKHDRGTIFVRSFPTDDAWARDTCPTYVLGNANNELIGIDWKFNAYGGPNEGCYWPCTNDQIIGRALTAALVRDYERESDEELLPLVNKDCLKRKPLDIVLEGGSIHVDGEGTLMTTEECLLNPNRNPDLKKSQIEAILIRELGCSKVLWLPHGIAYDEDTNGHIDNFCCFVRPGEVLLAWTDDMANDSLNYERCRAAERLLQDETDAKGRKLKIHKIHLPKPMHYTEEEVWTIKAEKNAALRKAGERLAASYVNFYICNGGIILPQFGDTEMDAKAVKLMEEIFPDKTIKPIYSREMLLGGGNIHCITQMMPLV